MKERMFKAEMLNQQLTQMEQQLSNVDQQHDDMQHLIDALDQFAKLRQGEKMLVSLAPGIFAHATFSGDTRLLVNVGQGVMVPKAPDEVQEKIHEQLEAMEQYQQELHKRFTQALDELNALKEEFKE